MPKEKLTLYLEPEHIEWLESQTDEEHKVSAVVRNLIRKAMKVKSRKKIVSVPMDIYGFSTITTDLIPNDLKDCADLIEECRESDRGYFFDSGSYIIDIWWDHNKDLYETNTPFIS